MSGAINLEAHAQQILEFLGAIRDRDNKKSQYNRALKSTPETAPGLKSAADAAEIHFNGLRDQLKKKFGGATLGLEGANDSLLLSKLVNGKREKITVPLRKMVGEDKVYLTVDEIRSHLEREVNNSHPEFKNSFLDPKAAVVAPAAPPNPGPGAPSNQPIPEEPAAHLMEDVDKLLYKNKANELKHGEGGFIPDSKGKGYYVENHNGNLFRRPITREYELGSGSNPRIQREVGDWELIHTDGDPHEALSAFKKAKPDATVMAHPSFEPEKATATQNTSAHIDHNNGNGAPAAHAAHAGATAPAVKSADKPVAAAPVTTPPPVVPSNETNGAGSTSHTAPTRPVNDALLNGTPHRPGHTPLPAAVTAPKPNFEHVFNIINSNRASQVPPLGALPVEVTNHVKEAFGGAIEHVNRQPGGVKLGALDLDAAVLSYTDDIAAHHAQTGSVGPHGKYGKDNPLLSNVLQRKANPLGGVNATIPPPTGIDYADFSANKKQLLGDHARSMNPARKAHLKRLAGTSQLEYELNLAKDYHHAINPDVAAHRTLENRVIEHAHLDARALSHDQLKDRLDYLKGRHESHLPGLHDGLLNSADHSAGHSTGRAPFSELMGDIKQGKMQGPKGTIFHDDATVLHYDAEKKVLHTIQKGKDYEKALAHHSKRLDAPHPHAIPITASNARIPHPATAAAASTPHVTTSHATSPAPRSTPSPHIPKVKPKTVSWWESIWHPNTPIRGTSPGMTGVVKDGASVVSRTAKRAGKGILITVLGFAGLAGLGILAASTRSDRVVPARVSAADDMDVAQVNTLPELAPLDDVPSLEGAAGGQRVVLGQHTARYLGANGMQPGMMNPESSMVSNAQDLNPEATIGGPS